MTPKRTLIIINPISGTKNKVFIERLLERYLSADRYNYGIEYTLGPTHATDLARSAAKDNFDLVIAVGGDGTVNEAAAGLINSNTALGIIPIGSGNGLARHFSIPTSVHKAIASLDDSDIMKIDVCMANGRPFFNVAGLGYDAEVALSFSQSSGRGLSAYIANGVRQWIKYSPRKFKISSSRGSFKRKALMVSLANGSQFGNNAWIAPEARIDDGLLDVCILHSFPGIAAPKLAYQLFSKHINQSPYLESFQTRELTIKQKSKIAHLDGEPFKLGKKIHFEVMPKALNIFAPKDFLNGVNTAYSLSRFE